MHFKNFYLRSFRLFLFPLALLYGLVVKTRNFLYEKQIIKSVEFNLPIICVGNISVGGTGKSPMVDYLVKLLKHKFPVATLSRGYKRRTSGYLLANDQSTDIEIGDEPMQFHLNHPDVAVAVGEKRIEAIPQLLYDRPDTKLIILDDAFQHREIFAGLNIILTDHSNLFTRDFFLPTGDLRDERHSMKRAQVIVVTKCPLALSEHERFKIIKEINPSEDQDIFFTTIHYDTPYHLVSGKKLELSKDMEVMLVCGIANPLPLTQYIHEHTKTYDAMFFSDHHLFNIDDLKAIKNRFDFLIEKNKIILTTEKDAVRLMKFKEKLRDIPIYVIPISLEFLFRQQKEFDKKVLGFASNFYSSKEYTA
jgi:tetraacyldisaccharide 4'-kinase